MNHFVKDVQYKKNDFIDSIVGFAVVFGFFTVLFTIATLVDVFGGH
ncbi:YqzM family protein [Halalkalibacterium halodurans]|nr:YqzM family protein [Halalkalibacterium halodurans]TPE69075.1 YqzM family protein [Halalkalibacterium halodurans]